MRRLMSVVLLLTLAELACDRPKPAPAPETAEPPASQPSTQAAVAGTTRPATRPDTQPSGLASTTQPSTQPATQPAIRSWAMRPVPADQVNLILIGDWVPEGRTPYQQRVAETMAQYVEATGTQFNAVLTTGGNTVGKLKGIEDPQFRKVFEDVYDPVRLNFPFFLTLGDGELKDEAHAVQLAYAEANPQSRWKLPAKWYRLDMPADHPLVTVLMLDSTKPAMSDEQWAEQTAWIQQQLAGPRATWTICVAHHPLFSNGAHGDNAVIEAEWGELLKQHDVDFYIAGQDHNVQHLELLGWPTSFLMAGSGGRSKTAFRRDDRGPFSRSLHGFAHLQATAEKTVVKFVDMDGEIVHHFERPVNGDVTIVSSTGRDKVSDKLVRVTAGFGETADSEDRLYGTTRPTTRPSPRPDTVANKPMPSDEVNLIAFGCYGADNSRQRLVARRLADYTNGLSPQFSATLLLGDNMYDKWKGVEDPKWNAAFEWVYDPYILTMPFYAILGNHDLEDQKMAMEFEYAAKHPQSRFKLPARWYRLEFPAEQPLVTVLMLDSNRHKLSPAEWARQTAWLEQELARPRTTKWLVAAAHHPLFSNGQHGDIGLLQVEWGALFKQYHVDFYLCAHEHNLQHLELPGWTTSFLVLGGGGRPRTELRRDDRGPFSRSLHGFGHLKFTADRATATLVNGKLGEVVHVFERTLHGAIEIAQTTPSDRAKKGLAPLKPFDETDTTTPVIPSMSPEPAR